MLSTESIQIKHEEMVKIPKPKTMPKKKYKNFK